jgi:hypothetical protein
MKNTIDTDGSSITMIIQYGLLSFTIYINKEKNGWSIAIHYS